MQILEYTSLIKDSGAIPPCILNYFKHRDSCKQDLFNSVYIEICDCYLKIQGQYYV